MVGQDVASQLIPVRGPHAERVGRRIDGYFKHVQQLFVGVPVVPGKGL